MVVLSDLIQRTQYSREVLQASIRKSVLWQSGLIVNDAELTRLMKANIGSQFEFDYFNDLTDNEGRISDDSATVAGTDGITTGTDKAIGNYRNRSWGAKNITANLSHTGDPLVAIAGRVGAYWARQMDFTAIAILNGIIAGNIAANASDMVSDNKAVSITINMILDTQQTAGDAQDMLGAMICHSAVRNSLKKQGVTDSVFTDDGKFLYETLGGLRLVITDAVPAGTNIPIVGAAAGDYLSYVVGKGMLGYGEGSPKVPNEVEKIAGTGNGEGSESLWSRKHFCVHPYGFSFVGTPASTSPTNTEFEIAASWTRNTVRKRIPFAALVTAL